VRASARVVAASAHASSILEALLVAGNRFENARAAHDLDAVGAQLAARKAYEGLLIPALNELAKPHSAFGRVLARYRKGASALRTLPLLRLSIAAKRRIRQDGFDPALLSAHMRRDTKKLHNVKTLMAVAKQHTSTKRVAADYAATTFGNTGELLQALHRQGVISDYKYLVARLAEARARCTPARRAAAMAEFRTAALARVAPAFRALLSTAITPLTNPQAPGITNLPSCRR
jgi:hypothetical protein